jgi:hypothetical protein
VDPDLKIEFEQAERSIENDRGLSAHYKASADQKQRLLDIARQESTRAEHYKQLYEDEHRQNEQHQAYIAKLEARVAELEARPTNVYADQYVNLQQVAQQKVHNQLVAGTQRKRGKNKILDLSNQLTLWPNPTTASW